MPIYLRISIENESNSRRNPVAEPTYISIKRNKSNNIVKVEPKKETFVSFYLDGFFFFLVRSKQRAYEIDENRFRFFT